jgi:hypothetical protein
MHIIRETNALMDVSEWLRSFAVEVLFGIGDNYAAARSTTFISIDARPTGSG